MKTHSRAESTWEINNYGKDINQFPTNTIKSIWQYERINKKICRQKMSIIFNKIFINIYIYIYIYITHTQTCTHTGLLAGALEYADHISGEKSVTETKNSVLKLTSKMHLMVRLERLKM